MEDIHALTLGELKQLVDDLLLVGANKDSRVLVYSDPEGNHLVSLHGFASLASTKGEYPVLATDVEPSKVTMYTRSDFESPESSVVLSAFENIYWEDEVLVAPVTDSVDLSAR